MSKDFLVVLVIAGGGLVLWLYDKYRDPTEEKQLLLHWNGWLIRNFGLPFEKNPPVTSVGVIKGHRLLRKRIGIAPPNRDSATYTLHADIILQDEQRRYWLVLAQSAYQGSGMDSADQVVFLREPFVQPINELRARRALFNDAKAYQHAFGEAPNRAALDAWRKRHPEQEPATRSRF